MIDINFQWTRSRLGYECVTRGSRRYISPVGQKRDTFEPLKFDTEKPLYSLFAELDHSEDAFLNFARVWGLLRSQSQTQAESVDDWKQEIDGLRQLLSILSDESPRDSSQTIKISTLDVSLRTADRSNRRPSLLLSPSKLIKAMYLQLGKSVAGGGSIGACKQCHGWFERGAPESRRGIAIFCSEKCKNRFHYLERAKR